MTGMEGQRLVLAILDEVAQAMSEPVDLTPCCELLGRALHHHWGGSCRS